MRYDMNYSMTERNWDLVKDFTSDEFGAVNMSGILVFTIQAMRNYAKRRIFINSGYRTGSSGYHPLNMAADLEIEDLHPIDMYLIAERFDAFNGIGVYTWGIHVDTRPKPKTDFDSRWGCLEKGVYVALNKEFFDKLSKREIKL